MSLLVGKGGIPIMARPPRDIEGQQVVPTVDDTTGLTGPTFDHFFGLNEFDPCQVSGVATRTCLSHDSHAEES